jgi:lactoylglutathione lyase
MLLSKGATPYEEPTNVGDEIVVAAVKDPWNNVLGIIYNPHFKLP